MTKLISTYAGATGLLIDQPNLKEHFYPHPFERYITIQTGSAQAAKCYSLWQEVVAMLKPILDANKIAILLLGGKDDPPLNGVHDLRGKTSFLQSHYLVKRSLLHIGNDSWVAHAAGWNYRPLVVLYGSTDPQPHGPYWYDVAKTELIVSHRHGGLPTYVMQESPKTIDLIQPEKVANAALRLLGVTDLFTHQTLSVGALYNHAVIELIPNMVVGPEFLPGLPVTVRMDLHFDEQVLAQVLSTGRKVNLITRSAINFGLLQQFRAQVLTYAHEIGRTDTPNPAVPYTDAIRSLFPNTHAFFTRELDERKVADLRFAYFDHVNISLQRDATKEDFVKGTLSYLNRPDTPENRLDIERQLGHAKVKTNRYVLSSGSIYLSHAHFAASKSVPSLQDNTTDLIDDPTTWRDANHFLVFSSP